MTSTVPGCFRRVRFSKDWRARVAVPEVVFEPGVNILAGPNGSGKSTVLQVLIQGARTGGPAKGVDVEVTAQPVRVMYFDFERMNPRVGSHLDAGVEIFQIRSRFSSHGETTRAILADLGRNREQFEGRCVLYDEPEQALDLDGLLLLSTTLRAAVDTAGAAQAIVATHAANLILAPDVNVIELVPGYVARVRAWAEGLSAASGTGTGAGSTRSARRTRR